MRVTGSGERKLILPKGSWLWRKETDSGIEGLRGWRVKGLKAWRVKGLKGWCNQSSTNNQSNIDQKSITNQQKNNPRGTSKARINRSRIWTGRCLCLTRSLVFWIKSIAKASQKPTKMKPKSFQNQNKNQSKNQHRFWLILELIFNDFWIQNWIKLKSKLYECKITCKALNLLKC